MTSAGSIIVAMFDIRGIGHVIKALAPVIAGMLLLGLLMLIGRSTNAVSCSVFNYPAFFWMGC